MADADAPGASLEAALTIIDRTPAVLRGLIGSLDPSVLGGGAPDGWAPRQVAEHLLDVEDVAFVDRVRRIVAGGHPKIASIDPPARLVEGGYADRSLDDLLDELHRRRAADVTWLRSLPDGALDQHGDHDRAGIFSARDLIHYWGCHDLLHLRQILQGLQDALSPHVGNLQKFFEAR